MRIKEGDESARLELRKRSQTMIEWSASKYAGDNRLLEEEMIEYGDMVFGKALTTYNPEKDRRHSFGHWLYLYLGTNNERIAREYHRTHASVEVETQTTDGHVTDSLPTFLNPQTAKLARLLASGFSPGEARIMLNLSEPDYRKKIKAIRAKLSDTKNGKFDSRLHAEWQANLAQVV